MFQGNGRVTGKFAVAMKQYYCDTNIIVITTINCPREGIIFDINITIDINIDMMIYWLKTPWLCTLNFSLTHRPNICPFLLLKKYSREIKTAAFQSSLLSAVLP